MFKLVLEKTEEPEIKLPTYAGSSKKQEFQKNMNFCFIDYVKAFDCGSQQTVENSLRLEWKLTFSSPVATVEFSKFAGILSVALSQLHLSGFKTAQLEFYHLY